MQGEQLIRDIPKGLIQWHQFHKEAQALFIIGGEACFEVLPEAMTEWGVSVECKSFLDFETAIQYAERL